MKGQFMFWIAFLIVCIVYCLIIALPPEGGGGTGTLTAILNLSVINDIAEQKCKNTEYGECLEYDHE